MKVKITNINRCVASIAVFFAIGSSTAQEPAYFQQEVNYTIHVKLNDQAHSLSASEEILYQNNSPQRLDTIYMHLWPNAYKNDETDLAKQLLRLGKTEFCYSKDEERGFIDSLDFKVNGESVKWNFHPSHQDIAYLILNSPLPPGESLKISTPFYVKIPDGKFSRLGHTEQAYFITQWYPKPAVFDDRGWHAMPYLNQGEFYSEYGSFDVHITLPENYLLAATGDRIDAEAEEKFLDEKVKETEAHIANGTRSEFQMKTPASSEKFKTVHFRQFRVHDFAWFADKRFYVLKDQIELPESKRLVNTWIYFTDKNFKLWKSALKYVNESTLFYSYHLGDYPYNHVTALDGTIMAGGGMEYPNITVINDPSSAFELDMVITHEVGHNWFYGILGSNEREHPFLDEGLNSLYELRYVRAKYPKNKLGTFVGKDSLSLFHLNDYPIWKYHELSHFAGMRSNSDQAMCLEATDYSEGNYGGVVYSKTAIAFDYLLDALGEEQFDAAMKFYYQKFKFKHPYPEDLFHCIAESSGANIAWFVVNLYLERNRIDLKIKSAKHLEDGSWVVKVRNKRSALVPFSVQALRDGKVQAEVWCAGQDKNLIIEIPKVDADQFVVDYHQRMPEMNRKNNSLYVNGIFKKLEPFQFNFISSLEKGAKTQVNYFPALGYNAYNGLMAGIAIHNYGIYMRPFEFAIAPMYAFGNSHITGAAHACFNIRPLNGPRVISIGVHAKSYSYDRYQDPNKGSRDLNFTRISPYLTITPKNQPVWSKRTQSFTYQSNLLFVDSADLTRASDGSFMQEKTNHVSFLNQFSYKLKDGRVINPYALDLQLQHTATMAKINATFNYQFAIFTKRAFHLRLFAGAFLAGSSAERSYYAYRASGYQGWQDYAFEANYMNRFASPNTFAGSQFLEKDGALKVWTPWGQSAQWMLALNLKSPHLGKLPLCIFVDAVSCDGRALNTDKVLWDAGLNLTIVKDIVEVYVPLIYSQDISNALSLNGVKWYQAFRFTFNIHKLDPAKILQTSLF